MLSLRKIGFVFWEVVRCPLSIEKLTFFKKPHEPQRPQENQQEQNVGGNNDQGGQVQPKEVELAIASAHERAQVKLFVRLE